MFVYTAKAGPGLWRAGKSSDGKTVSANNPGKIFIDFMGLTTEYRISFSGEPVFGADFKAGTVYDYSNNPQGADIYADFAAENTRSCDFDARTRNYSTPQESTEVPTSSVPDD